MKEEENEEPSMPKEMHLQLNQKQAGILSIHRIHHPKKKGKRCWLCKSWKHMKCNCPKLKCWYCGIRGHTKKKCYKYELHLAIQIIRNIPGAKQEKKTQKRKNNTIDRFKEVEFRQDNGEMIMSHKGTDLAVYIGENSFSYAKN